MKVLVLGGTGAMGLYLVELLKNSDFEVFVTSRSYRESDGNVNYLQGNARDISFIESLLVDKWDAIIDFMVYSTVLFEQRVNLFLNATAQYVFLSSARVYADSENPIKEESQRLLDVCDDVSYLSTDEYALSKARQEDILKKSGKVNWTIIRPYITYSQDRLQLGVLEKEDWLYRALNRRTIIFSKDIICKFTTMTFGGDVAKSIVSVLGKKNAFGEVLHVVNDKSNSWEEILEIYLDVINKKFGFRPKVIFQNLEGFLLHHPVKYQIFYDRNYNRVFDNSKLSRYTETSNFIETHEGLKMCLEKFIESPSFKPINLGREALKDRISNEYMSLNEIETFKNKLKYIIYRYLIKYKY